MAKCNCPKKKNDCGCKKAGSKKKDLYSFRVKKGQMTPGRAAQLKKRDKKLNFK